MKLEEMLKEWREPLAVHDVNSAEDLIDALEIELAGKKEIIKELRKDIDYYRLKRKEFYVGPCK